MDRIYPVSPLVYHSLPFPAGSSGDFCYYFSLVTNITGLILGVLMLFQPAFTLFTVGALIGIYLIAAGIESIILALSRMGSGW